MSGNITDTNTFRISAWPTGRHEEVRERVAAHRKADDIFQGFGWNGSGQGCAIGCSLDKYDHAEYARVLGVAPEIAFLVDYIHEELPRELSLDWPGRVVNALQPGADTTHVWPKFVVWLLREKYPSNRTAQTILGLYERRIARDEPPIEEWEDKLEWIEATEPGDAEEGLVWAIARTTWAVSAAKTARTAIEAAEDAGISYQQQADALIEILSGSA